MSLRVSLLAAIPAIALIATAVSSAGLLLALPAAAQTAPPPAAAATSPAVPAAAAPTTICGRPADVSQLLLAMQKPSVENVFRDKMIFVLRDTDDNSIWAFSIKHTTVHPAARCQRTTAGSAPKLEVEQICGASEKACASFASQADARFKTFAAPLPAGPAKTAN